MTPMQDTTTSSTAVEPGSPGTVPVRSAPPRYGTDSDHLLDKLAVIARYRRIAAAVFVLVSGAIMVQGYTQVPLFEAQARILIEDERSTAMPGITTPENTYWQDPEPYYNTQYRILRGRDLTRRVVKRLNLSAVPEFNGTAAGPTGPVDLLRQLAHRKVPRAFIDYAESGSYAEQTLRANRADMERIKLRQRVLVNVDQRSAATTILGEPAALPRSTCGHTRAAESSARSASTTSMPFLSLPCCSVGKFRSGNEVTAGTPALRSMAPSLIDNCTVLYSCAAGSFGAGRPSASGSPPVLSSVASGNAPRSTPVKVQSLTY